EGPFASIPVQLQRRLSVPGGRWKRPAVEQKDVLEAIVVIIEEPAARAHCLNEALIAGAGIRGGKGNARRGSGVDIVNGHSGTLRMGQRAGSAVQARRTAPAPGEPRRSQEEQAKRDASVQIP